MLKRINRDLLAIILCGTLSIVTFWPFFSEGKIPVPGDIILGAYYPWQDISWDNYSTIFPVLNPTISDSITSFYPWKYKSFELIKQGQFPLFDDSSYMGGPLFGTGTSGFLYPLNILFLLFPFNFGWSLLTALTPILAATFFYIWIRNKGINYWAAILGGISYAYSAFIALQFSFINSPHAVLWLPLILFCIDKIFKKFQIKIFILLIFALFSSINAGFFQGSLYIMGFSFGYLIFEVISKKADFKKLLTITGSYIFAILLSAIQIIPFIETTMQSSRVSNYGTEATRSEIFDFFVKPYYLLTTFIPDFFGNPGKKNYWGDPNYYEFNNFMGSIIIIGITLLLVNFKHLLKLKFFIITFFVSLILVIPNFISEYPYLNSWPILSSLTPSRLLLITQFCLIVLGTYGLDLLFKKEISPKKVIIALCITLNFYLILLFISIGKLPILSLTPQWTVILRNTIVSLSFIFLFVVLIVIFIRFKHKHIIFALILLSSFELIRQTSYFRPFIKEELLYPDTDITRILKENNDYRFIITDPRLFPSNLQTVYSLEAIDGVSPLFSDRYNQFIFSLNSKNIGNELPRFRRTVFFTNYTTPLIDILNVRYILSLEKLDDPRLKLISKDHSTYLYENITVLPKVRIVKNIERIDDPTQTVKRLKEPTFDYKNTAIVPFSLKNFTKDDTLISEVGTKNGKIEFKSKGDGVAVISYQYIPGWKAYIDNKETSIYPVNYGLMGIVLPEGEHKIELKYQPISFILGSLISLFTLTLLFVTTIFVFLRGRKNN